MNYSFTRAEYWILEAAVERSILLADLPDGEAAGKLNRTDHETTREELAEALDRLAKEGLIFAFDGSTEPRRPVLLTRAVIEEELHRVPYDKNYDGVIVGPCFDTELYYRLTPEGGAAWEAFARPDWSQFISPMGAEHVYGYAFCADRSCLERYLDLLGHMIGGPKPDRPRWRAIAPWEATYWKTLPRAHLVVYRLIPNDSPPAPYSSQAWQCMKRWYRWKS